MRWKEIDKAPFHAESDGDADDCFKTHLAVVLESLECGDSHPGGCGQIGLALTASETELPRLVACFSAYLGWGVKIKVHI
jgi:hypothetical protein